nr:MAG TPA: hypothetical protein [Caudoviricetes sp.]
MADISVVYPFLTVNDFVTLLIDDGPPLYV